MIVAAALDRQEPVTAAGMRILSSLSYRHGELDTYLQALVNGLCSCIQADWVVITFNQLGSDSILASCPDTPSPQPSPGLDQFLERSRNRRGNGVCLIDTSHADGSALPEGYGTGVGIRMHAAQGNIIGTLAVFNRHYCHFGEDLLYIVQAFADRAATAVDNYLICQRQQRFNQVLVEEIVANRELCRASAICQSPPTFESSELQADLPEAFSPSAQMVMTALEVTLARLSSDSGLPAVQILGQQALEKLLQVRQYMRDIRRLLQVRGNPDRWS